MKTGSLSGACRIAAWLGMIFSAAVVALHAQTIPSSGAIAAGTAYNLAVKGDGTVWAWGLNANGQLGDGTTTQRLSPTAVSGLTTVAAVAAGDAHSLALRTDGTVRSWGLNANGELGDNTTTQRNSPVTVSGLSAVKSIAAGSTHSLALKNDGTVWAWGKNSNGQIGDGTTTQRATPVKISSLSGIIAIAAGASHSLALKSDGTVWVWGLNTNGQLGDGTTTQRTAPVKITSLSGIVAIAAGDAYSLALKADGTAVAWGLNSNGQLGDASTTQRTAPVAVSGLTGVAELAAGITHSLARKTDGTVWAWGKNANGQLGDGTTTQHTAPVQIPGVANAAGLAAGSVHTLVLRTDGSIMSLGSDDNGQLGDGVSTLMRATPVPVNVSVLLTAAGKAHGLAIMADHTLVAWGSNASGQLGDGTTTSRAIPARIGGSVFTVWNAVAAGDSHSLAVVNDGTVWAWGLNTNGQIGDGTTNQYKMPKQITALTSVSAVAAGASHSLALKTDGTVWAWGLNSNGQLGDGTTTQRLSPVKISALSGIIAIEAGDAFSLALKSDGTVWAWGLNSNGQLGDGTTTQRTAPVKISSLSGITLIAAGGTHALALKSDGTIRSWGLNTNGQLGDGTTTQRSTPVTLSGVTSVTAIAAGSSFSLARKSDGTVWAWGLNSAGQLGDGTTTQRTSPVAVLNLTGASAVCAGADFALAVKTDQSLLTWGNNASKQLAINSLTRSAAALGLRVSSADTDGDGLPDTWEMAHFGSLAQNGTGDFDKDGLTNIQEYALGSDPANVDTDGDLTPDAGDIALLDYYNGQGPVITLIGGNNQTGVVNKFNAAPLDVAVSIGGKLLVNAPVYFTVYSGGGKLAVSPTSTTLADQIMVRTDADGTAQAYYQQPTGVGVQSQITATWDAAGQTGIMLTTTSIQDPTLDTDHDGIPDNWEIAHGLNPYSPDDANMDNDGDGYSNLREYQNGTDPSDPDPAIVPLFSLAKASVSADGTTTVKRRPYQARVVYELKSKYVNDPYMRSTSGATGYLWYRIDYTYNEPNATLDLYYSYVGGAPRHRILKFTSPLPTMRFFSYGIGLEEPQDPYTLVDGFSDSYSFPYLDPAIDLNSNWGGLEAPFWPYATGFYPRDHWFSIVHAFQYRVPSPTSPTGELNEAKVPVTFVYTDNSGNPVTYAEIGTMTQTRTGGIQYPAPPPMTSDTAVQKLRAASYSFSDFTQLKTTAQAFFDNTDIATAQKMQYKLVLRPGFTGRVMWMETFTPKGTDTPTDMNLMWYDAIGGETTTPTYTIDPLEAGNAHRFPGQEGKYEVKIIDVGLCVDANHDGILMPPTSDPSNPATAPLDIVTADKPYRFWINDDFDSLDPLTPSTIPNYSDSQVNGSTDLKDFFPIFLNLKSLLSVLPAGTDVVYKLRQADGALKFAYTDLTRDTAFSYKTGDPGALRLATTYQITADGTVLSPSFLDSIKNNDHGVILLEGAAPTVQPLVLTVEKAGAIIAQVSLPLSIGQDIVLLLHGMNSNTQTWDAFVTSDFNESAQDIVDGAIVEGPAPARNASGVRCYRLQFGTYDAVSSRQGVEGVTAANTPGYSSYPTRCGDFETFAQLGQEVDNGIAALLTEYPNARIALVGHSRGGLSARAFFELSGSPINKTAVVAFLTTSSPHLGSRMGRIYSWLDNHPRNAPGTDTQDWAVVDWLLSPTVTVLGVTQNKPPLDVRRPVIMDVADDSSALSVLNAQPAIQTLPSKVRYGEIVYNRAHFGQLSLSPVRYSVIEATGGGVIFPQLPNATANFLLNGLQPDDPAITGDGLIPASNQIFTSLPGFVGVGIAPWIITDSEVVHTEAPSRTPDLHRQLKLLMPEWFQ